MRGDQIRALRRLQREQDPPGSHVFASERGGPMTPTWLGHRNIQHTVRYTELAQP